MTPDEVKAALARFTYKPGYKIMLCPPEYNFFGEITHKIEIEAILPDSHNPDQTCLVGRQFAVPTWINTPDDLFQILSREVHNLEWHEADEWAKVDGVPLFDPHRKMTS